MPDDGFDNLVQHGRVDAGRDDQLAGVSARSADDPAPRLAASPTSDASGCRRCSPSCFRDVDALLMPIVPVPAIPHDHSEPFPGPHDHR